MSLKVRFEKLRPDAIMPQKSRDDDAGYDLFCLDEVRLPTGVPVKIPTGIALEIPKGYVGLIWDRSGFGSKGIQRLAGVIDASYRGDITVCLINNKHGNNREEVLNHVNELILAPYSKVAQILIQPVLHVEFEEAESLSETDRGSKGFGSSDNAVGK